MSTTENKTVIVVGGGNMGTSLAKGLIANNWNAEQIIICEQNQARQESLRNDFPQCEIRRDCLAPIPSSYIIILAVKPQAKRVIAIDGSRE